MHAGDIVTIAGGPCTGPTPNPAPSALALDPAGDLFIAYGIGSPGRGVAGHRHPAFGMPVTAGTPVTIAGTGVAGLQRRRRPGPAACSTIRPGWPSTPSGDLLIADTANCRLRLVAASTGTRFGVPVVQGHIYTVAGNGICGSGRGRRPGAPTPRSGIRAPWPSTPAGTSSSPTRETGPSGCWPPPAGTFYGVTIAADHLGTVAGEGSYGPYLVDGLSAVGETAELNFPTAIAVDSQGNLYIADGAMHAIRFVPAVTTTLLGKTAQAGDMYTAAGAMGTGALRDGTAGSRPGCWSRPGSPCRPTAP